MLDLRLLAIGSDDRFLELLRWQLQDVPSEGIQLTVARTIEQACSMVEAFRPRLIIVHPNRGGADRELNQLLWATTLEAHKVPVIVVADCYRVGQATRLYGMGVTEYISRTHHAYRFGRVLDTYLRHWLTRRDGLDASSVEERGSFDALPQAPQAVGAPGQ
jgi:response regulator of citrate/malate metabolism